MYILKDSLIEHDPELALRKLPDTLEGEFGGYMRPRDKSGRYNPKEDPVKKNDHGLDTLRYLIFTIGSGIHKDSSAVVSATISEVSSNHLSNTPGQISRPGQQFQSSGSARSYTSGGRPSWGKWR